MLIELKNIRQIDGEDFRRWFKDSSFDLIVWYRENSRKISGFQLCYDMGTHTEAFTWRVTSGFSHNLIDDNFNDIHHSQSPILADNYVLDRESIANKFRDVSHKIERIIVDTVLRKIDQFPGK